MYQFFPEPSSMYFVVFALLVAVATAAPQYSESSDRRELPDEVVPILKDERVHEEDGRYSLDVETGNSIFISQSGSPGPEGSVNTAGEYSYIAPDGTPVVVTFVADENGYQPQSDVLPVAPAFPHPIPQYVLDQIAFAAENPEEERSEVRDTYN
ncbi:cuticle protein AMP1A-like [Panulirus ornatus]|uniref:cuticle protein AMP1A-like n=1 Tax=Panulirus ornatus TaxID=150431 RepID=UPI003A8AE6FA